jgi:hypothetical protein
LFALALALVAASCAQTAPSPAAAASTGLVMPFHIERLLETFDGTAAAVVQVPSYTYVAVQLPASGAVRWVASLKKDIAVGAPVHIKSFGTQRDFRSARLQATFAQLWFAVVTVTQQQGGRA